MSDWFNFVDDLTNSQYNDFILLSRTAQLKAFDYWMKTEGEHIDYSFKN